MRLRFSFGLSSEREMVEGIPVAEMPVLWTLSVVVCVLGAWFTGSQSRFSVLLGGPLLLVGGLAALWSIRTLGRGNQLVTWGPYALVRHPYSLAILIMVVGAIVALRSWPGLILLLPTLRLTVDRARREEHNLAIRFGDEWEGYRREVPFLLPLPGRSRRNRPPAVS
ncbi:MAG: isoprenylcysteine carboxylmethyltransferase family protein [Thermoanaerobaculaceae bacterium]|nr:isoprenylcysteine carboxylmethyltransferase family protein [Thermoanaerobaculaceae bacterium]MDI9623066.1 methyltransferase [Acidobacteriota bacterium]NLH10553.1 isoprenylcysteine carboxylmethyltransferase family protein [Holophagae bacterium]HPW55381.1 methyltransferase [Thermoanaerobaculaceae bacterium]